MERTTVRGNTLGVVLLGIVMDLDLGGGSRESEGQNVFAGNEEADLCTPIGTTVSAIGNFWDGSQGPSDYVGRDAPDGTDIWRRGPSASVDSSGAMSVFR